MQLIFLPKYGRSVQLNILCYIIHRVLSELGTLHAPIPLMKTVFSLCSISIREKPVFITWEPCNENRFFLVWKYYTGKTLFWPCKGLQCVVGAIFLSICQKIFLSKQFFNAPVFFPEQKVGEILHGQWTSSFETVKRLSSQNREIFR